ncbi:hypothetical protein CE91St41_11790 [Oscillospiraceae bacterium]|nr:hypothetical protein CE91St40_25750 [Oscillospiraceae bacterium]BDF74290.1 hypothetical protein CE91St41_11790 [Oscillospiraceae bacterium]
MRKKGPQLRPPRVRRGGAIDLPRAINEIMGVPAQPRLRGVLRAMNASELLITGTILGVDLA